MVVAAEKLAPEQSEDEYKFFKPTNARTWPYPFTWSFDINNLFVVELPRRMASEKRYIWSTNLSSGNTINAVSLVVKTPADSLGH